MHYICLVVLHGLVGCRLPPLDGYMAVWLALTIDVYEVAKTTSLFDLVATPLPPFMRVYNYS